MLPTADLATTNLSSTSYVSAWAQGNCPCCYKLFPLLPNPGCPPPWSLYNHVNVNILKISSIFVQMKFLHFLKGGLISRTDHGDAGAVNL